MRSSRFKISFPFFLQNTERFSSETIPNSLIKMMLLHRIWIDPVTITQQTLVSQTKRQTFSCFFPVSRSYTEAGSRIKVTDVHQLRSDAGARIQKQVFETNKLICPNQNVFLLLHQV